MKKLYATILFVMALIGAGLALSASQAKAGDFGVTYYVDSFCFWYGSGPYNVHRRVYWNGYNRGYNHGYRWNGYNRGYNHGYGKRYYDSYRPSPYYYKPYPYYSKPYFYHSPRPYYYYAPRPYYPYWRCRP